MQDWFAFWHAHWDTFAHYVGIVVPWMVETKLRYLALFLSWPAVVLYLVLTFLLMLVPPERQLMIPMRAGNRSLNLSNAVALVIYEAWRQNDFAGARPAGITAASPGDH